MFSPLHIVQIIITLGVLIGVFFLFKNKKQCETKVYIFLSIGTVGLIVAMFIWSIVNNIYNPEWYAPFHICNLFYIIFPIMAIFKKHARKFLYEYTFFFGIIGCLFAICMPSTTQLYFQPFHFISICTWLYHILIGVGSIYLISSKIYSPKISNLWKTLAVLLPLIFISFIFNYLWGTNFCFMNPTKLYYPLNIFADYLGKYFTHAILLVIVGTCALLMTISVAFAIFKTVLVSKIIKESKIFIYLKENNLLGKLLNTNIAKALLSNEKVKEYLSSTKILINDTNFEKCYNAVSFELANLTVEQLGDMKYMISLLNKSDLVATVFKQLKLSKIKLLYKNVRSIPVEEIIQVIKNTISEEQNKKLLSASTI